MALLASGSVGGFTLPSFGNSGSLPSSFPTGPGGGTPVSGSPDQGAYLAQFGEAMSQVLPILNQERGVFIGLGGFWLLLLLGIWALAVRSEAALSWASLQLARDGSAPRRRAWREGRHLFWRYVGLSLIGWISSLVVGIVPVLWAMSHRSGDSVLDWFQAYSGAVSSPLFLLAALLLVPVSITLNYAKRPIAMHDASLIYGLARGWRTLRSNFGTSLLAWIINLAFYFGAFVGLFIAVMVLTVIVVIGFVVVLHALPNGMDSLAGGLAPYIAAGVLLFALMLMLTLALISLFLWTFWSQVYLRLNPPAYDSGSMALG